MLYTLYIWYTLVFYRLTPLRLANSQVGVKRNVIATGHKRVFHVPLTFTFSDLGVLNQENFFPPRSVCFS